MSRGNNKSSIAAEGTQWYGNIVSSTLQAYYEVYYVNLSDNTCKRIYPWYIEDNEFILTRSTVEYQVISYVIIRRKMCQRFLQLIILNVN